MKIKDYKTIYNELYKNDKFRNLSNEIHHGDNRLSHTKRVAKLSFYLSKCCKCDKSSVVRGAFLHDFFLSSELDNHKLICHPSIAYKNANIIFNLNKVEKDIIENHMFPITKTIPKTKEGIIVSLSDKIISIYEFLRFQLKTTSTILIIFTFEILKEF